MGEKINSLFRIAGGAARSLSEGFNGVVKQITEVQVYDVVNELEKMEIKRPHYTTEKHVEGVIAAKLEDRFGYVHRQYNIGGFLGLKVDIDVMDGRIGLEIKLAKELSSATCIERLFGQVLYYSRRVYKENLIVVIVGTKKEYTQVIREIEAICTEQKVSFHYLEIG